MLVFIFYYYWQLKSATVIVELYKYPMRPPFNLFINFESACSSVVNLNGYSSVYMTNWFSTYFPCIAVVKKKQLLSVHTVALKVEDLNYIFPDVLQIHRIEYNGAFLQAKFICHFIYRHAAVATSRGRIFKIMVKLIIQFNLLVDGFFFKSLLSSFYSVIWIAIKSNYFQFKFHILKACRFSYSFKYFWWLSCYLLCIAFLWHICHS